MIVFQILPNEALKPSLKDKISTVLLGVSDIPVYDIKSDEENFLNIVKEGESNKVVEKIVRVLKKELAPRKKGILEYLKTYIHQSGKKDGFEISLTLYFYNEKKQTFEYVQKKVISPNGTPMVVNKHFFKMLVGKEKRYLSFFEIVIIDMMLLAFDIIKSKELHLVSQEIWEKSLMWGGDADE